MKRRRISFLLDKPLYEKGYLCLVKMRLLITNGGGNSLSICSFLVISFLKSEADADSIIHFRLCSPTLFHCPLIVSSWLVELIELSHRIQIVPIGIASQAFSGNSL